MTCAGSNTELGEAVAGKSIQIPSTKEAVSLCSHCNKHHTSTQLPAARDSCELQILFEFNFPADFLAQKGGLSASEVFHIWVDW